MKGKAFACIAHALERQLTSLNRRIKKKSIVKQKEFNRRISLTQLENESFSVYKYL